MLRRVRFCLAVALLAVCFAGAERVAAQDDHHQALRERMQKASELGQEAMQLMTKGNYAAAVDKWRASDKAMPGNPSATYNLACALARTGRPDEAMQALAQSVEHGFLGHAHMVKDPDLVSLRDRADFKELVDRVKEAAKPKDPLLSVPESYATSGDKAYPLFVVLHGAGSSAERMMPWIRNALPAEKFIVMVPFGGSKVGPGYTWNSNDPAILASQIAALRKQYRISRVYLLGFSAGGHLGYGFVLAHRDSVDGFIPMAGAFNQRHSKPGALRAAKGLPVFAIQGRKDRMVPLAAAEESLEVFKEHGAYTKLYKHDGGHVPPRNLRRVLQDAVAWIDARLDGATGD